MGEVSTCGGRRQCYRSWVLGGLGKVSSYINLLYHSKLYTSLVCYWKLQLPFIAIHLNLCTLHISLEIIASLKCHLVTLFHPIYVIAINFILLLLLNVVQIKMRNTNISIIVLEGNDMEGLKD